MIRVRAADVLDKYLGGSEAIVRSLFARARSASPVILLFDEIDSIASNRASDGDGTGVMPRILSTLLNEMDGVSSGLREPVLVLACTNRLESLDAALLRPGRLEEHIEFPPPSVEDAEAILRLYLRKVMVDENVDLRKIAAMLVLKGYSAAAFEGLAREAVMSALRRTYLASTTSSVAVLEIDFEEAMLAL
jgi:SpoVK/Ycf46/Vps4 family AAA+-type ATPase